MFKKGFGCGSLILIFIVTISIVAIGGYFAFSAYISPYLNNANVQEIYDIYLELSEPVSETELVTNAPEVADYDTAKNSLTTGGINIFNEHGDIDPALIETSNFIPTGNILLTDKELASIINKFIENPLNLEKLGINEEDIGGLETQVLEVNIDALNQTDILLGFVVKLDMTTIKTQLGFFGFFLPDILYVESSNTLQLIENTYTLIDGAININNLDEDSNVRILEILVEVLKTSDESLTIETIQEGIGKLILSGLQEISTTFNASVTFGDGTITFIPNTPI